MKSLAYPNSLGGRDGHWLIADAKYQEEPPRAMTDRLGRLLLVTLEAARVDAHLPVFADLRAHAV